MKLKLCFYEKQGEHWGVRKLDSIITEEDKEEFHQMYSKEQLPEGFDIKKQSGVVLYYQDVYKRQQNHSQHSPHYSVNHSCQWIHLYTLTCLEKELKNTTQKYIL